MGAKSLEPRSQFTHPCFLDTFSPGVGLGRVGGFAAGRGEGVTAISASRAIMALDGLYSYVATVRVWFSSSLLWNIIGYDFPRN